MTLIKISPGVNPKTGNNELEWECPKCFIYNYHNGRSNKISPKQFEEMTKNIADHMGLDHDDMTHSFLIPLQVWCQKCESQFDVDVPDIDVEDD